LVIATAVIGKFGGACFSSKLILKMNWRDSVTIGILMNTKGLVELIVLNIGLQTKVLNTKVFSIFVLMAIVTTIMTTPLVYLVYQRGRKVLKDIKDVELGSFSAAIHISDPKMARWLGVVIGMFKPKNGQLDVKGILVREIDDRPSTYFFAELRRGRDDLSLLSKKKKDTSPWIERELRRK